MTGKMQGKGFNARRIASVMMIIALSVMLFACGSSGSKNSGTKTSKPKGKLNACSVLSEKIASDILHGKVTKSDAFPRNMDLQGGKVQNSICSYDAPSSGRSLGLNLTYAPIYHGKHPTLEEFKKGASQSGKEVGKPVPVTGIGDFAVWNIAYGVGMLTFYAGDYHGIITIRNKSKGASKSDLEPAKKAANKILSNL